MLRKQDGLCAVCKEPGKSKYEESPLVVDHDHITRKIRALLCARCNVMLGFLESYPDLMESLLRYKESHK